MKQFKRCGSIALVALLLISVLLNGLTPIAFADGIGSGYTCAEDVQYVKVGTYVANWGYRGETCSFLSPMANAFYTDEYDYATLSELVGGSGQYDAPGTALYEALHDLMADNHTTLNSYGDSRYLFKYTDCQLSQTDTILSFYSGVSFAGEWDNGKTWNREHTWPSSKCLNPGHNNNTKDESTDIMMLRPALTSENGSRGNKAYGESSGYCDPGVDVRGDCARVFLYMYVRWQITDGNGDYSTWGSNGVIESLDILLKWMEEDPVDTWEMGRNDAVESITGTRNVFVDYPQYAWLLFGREVPADYQSPSGESGGVSCAHENIVYTPAVNATCVYEGADAYYTCQDCGRMFSNKECTVPTSLSAVVVPATGKHDYENGCCKVCGREEPTTEWETADVFADGDKIILVAEYGGKYYAMSNSISSSIAAAIEVETMNGVPVNVNISDFAWTLRDAGDGKFYLENEQGQLKVSKTNLSVSASGAAFSVSTDRVSSTSDRALFLQETSDDLRFKNYAISNLSTSTYAAAVVYKYSKVESACDHQWTDATCTAPKTCTLCGETEGEALGHTDADGDGNCDRCGTALSTECAHNWTDATCTDPKTCTLCGATEGEALGHDWRGATCTSAKICAVCGETEGEALGHDWRDATCTSAKTCAVCGATEGEALGHDFGEWQITREPTVTLEGERSHSCTRCGLEETQSIEKLPDTGSENPDEGKNPDEGENPGEGETPILSEDAVKAVLVVVIIVVVVVVLLDAGIS